MSKLAPASSYIPVIAATKRRLKKLAKLAGRSSTLLATEAINEYLDLNEAQIAGIKKAVASVDRGESIPHDHVREWCFRGEAQTSNRFLARPYEPRGRPRRSMNFARLHHFISENDPASAQRWPEIF